MKYTKKEFYKNFYNNNLFRDFLFVKTNPTIKYNTESPKISYSNEFNSVNQTKKNILNFLIKYANPKLKLHGALYSQVTYYKTINAFKDKSESDRNVNCLFFDFDSDADELHDLKNEIKTAYENLTGKDRIKKISEIQNEYQNILFDSDLLDKPFNDAKKLYDYFKSNNITPYTVFSGSKGIHLYIFFDECKLNNYSEISYKLANSYKSALNLETVDLAVNKDAIARKSRVIYSKHETSGLFTTPFDIESDSIADILHSAEKQQLMEFNLSDYAITDDEFVGVLKSIDATINEKNAEIISEKKKLKPTINGNSISDADKDAIFSDMRILLKLILGNPVREFTDYNTYNCPFHDDKSPSARVYKNNFLCATDNLHLNYFEFIRKYFDLTPDDDSKESKFASDERVKEKMKELKMLVMKEN